MERLKIVQVSHTFPPYVTGLGHVVEMLSLNLSRLGHEVEVVTLDPSYRLKSQEYYKGIRVTRFPCIAPHYNSYFLPSPKVVEYLSSLKADIVHVHNVGALLVPASWIAVGRGNRDSAFIVSPHHHEQGSLWHTRLMWRLYKPLAKKVLESADSVHCVSEFEAKVVRKDFGVDPVVVQNGVADDVLKFRWNPPKDRLVLTYAGRLERYKRVGKLLEVSSILSEKGYSNTVRVVGKGPELPNIVSTANRLNVNLENYPFLPREEYLEMLSTSSYFLNLSMYEAFSLTTAEALGIGVPSVVSVPWGETFQDFANVSIVNGDNSRLVVNSILGSVNSISHSKLHVGPWSEISARLVESVYRPTLGQKAGCVKASA
ncbi:MAG: glycosyltransferase family 4 protein [Nitrososphaerota archaeon]|nr:glycosyltransferase family 4 protein [Nitrososphaerota archaeon]